MGFLDRLLGREQQPAPPPVPQRGPVPGGGAQGEDERAIERYRYLLRTAPPDRIEQAHAEAFANLTPEQRRQVLTSLNAELPEAERAQGDDPQTLARTATRAEVQRPGILERSFGGRGMGGMGGGIGLGGIVAGSLLASVAGSFVGTAIAGAMLNEAYGGEGGGDEAGGEAGAEDAGGEAGGYADAGSGDTGGDYGGDFGGDFGGGFGGGEF